MIQSILHIIGICPDHFNHVNLFDIPYQEILNFINQVKLPLRK
jgi:hypothetical protein